MAEPWKARVEAATVSLPKLGGRGVLVPGGFVLTATHCIEWDGAGGMALGDHHLVPVVTKSGATFNLSPVAADAISDLAVLAAPDDQTFLADARAFEKWAEETASVPLSGAFDDWCPRTTTPGAEQAFAAQCLAHTGAWVTGRATRIAESDEPLFHGAWFEWTKPVKGGASGGPIVDEAGRLVGVVSSTNVVAEGECDGMQPLATYALPRWVFEHIKQMTAAG